MIYHLLEDNRRSRLRDWYEPNLYVWANEFVHVGNTSATLAPPINQRGSSRSLGYKVVALLVSRFTNGDTPSILASESLGMRSMELALVPYEKNIIKRSNLN